MVSMRDVSRRYGDLAAVDDVTLDVPRGTILGVIGPSGSGKTTLIRMLTGTLEPTSGELRVLGQDPRKFTRHTREQHRLHAAALRAVRGADRVRKRVVRRLAVRLAVAEARPTRATRC